MIYYQFIPPTFKRANPDIDNSGKCVLLSIQGRNTCECAERDQPSRWQQSHETTINMHLQEIWVFLRISKIDSCCLHFLSKLPASKGFCEWKMWNVEYLTLHFNLKEDKHVFTGSRDHIYNKNMFVWGDPKHIIYEFYVQILCAGGNYP